MRVPNAIRAGIHLHESRAAFDQSPRGEQPLAGDLRVVVVQAVKLLGLLRLASHPDCFRHRHLHVEGKLVRLDTSPYGFILGILNRRQVVQLSRQFEFIPLLRGQYISAPLSVRERIVRIELQGDAGYFGPK